MTRRRPPAGRASVQEADRLRLDGHVGQLQVAAATHVGKVRTNNEDFAVTETIERAGVTYRLLLIADGMGGGAKGEVASELASALVARHLKEEPWAGPHEALAEAFKEANAVVYDRGTGGGEAPRSLMGTTLVAVLVDDTSGRTWLAHAGDSRAYLLPAAGGIQRLTRDHSLVEERVREGQMTEREAEASSERNVVTRAIGPYAQVEAELTGPLVLNAGDTLLLSTDGLHGMVSDERIRRGIARPKTLEALSAQLIGLGLAGGGKDNVTVVVAAWGGLIEVGGSAGRGGLKGLAPAAAVVGAGAIVLTVAGLAWAALKDDAPQTVAGAKATLTSSPEAISTRTTHETSTQSRPFVARTLRVVVAGDTCTSLALAVLSLSERQDTPLETAVKAIQQLNGLTDASCKLLQIGSTVCLPAVTELAGSVSLNRVDPGACEDSSLPTGMGSQP